MEAIKKELLVNASQETAFRVFTEQMDAWWPKTHHIGAAPMVHSLIEGKAGGRWYSMHEDGSEANVGTVLVWDPFGRLVLNWQVNGNFQYDPSIVSEVEIVFEKEGARSTRIRFEHRDLERLMGGPKVIADMDNGWWQILQLFKKVTDEA
jgi:uncharacterized protein YndB with AHSA1/START domain